MRVTIRLKLGLAFAAVIAVAAASVMLGISRLGTVNAAMDEVLHGPAQRALAEAQLNVNLLRLARAEKNLVLADKPEQLDQADAEISATAAEHSGTTRSNSMRSAALKAGGCWRSSARPGSNMSPCRIASAIWRGADRCRTHANCRPGKGCRR